MGSQENILLRLSPVDDENQPVNRDVRLLTLELYDQDNRKILDIARDLSIPRSMWTGGTFVLPYMVPRQITLPQPVVSVAAAAMGGANSHHQTVLMPVSVPAPDNEGWPQFRIVYQARYQGVDARKEFGIQGYSELFDIVQGGNEPGLASVRTNGVRMWMSGVVAGLVVVGIWI